MRGNVRLENIMLARNPLTGKRFCMEQNAWLWADQVEKLLHIIDQGGKHVTFIFILYSCTYIIDNSFYSRTW